MADREKSKAWIAAARKSRRSSRRGAGWPDATEMLAALVYAWTVTVFASALLVGAVAVARVWDGAVFRHALLGTLSRDPGSLQPFDDFPIADTAGMEIPGGK